MLRIEEVSLELCAVVLPLAGKVAVHDADLARQLRRAMTSVPLNIAEGSGSRGGTRRCRYETALGSAREAWMAGPSALPTIRS